LLARTVFLLVNLVVSELHNVSLHYIIQCNTELHNVSLQYSTTSYNATLLTHRSSTRPLLTIPYIQSNFARRSFCFTSPTVWNSLPVNIQSSPSQGAFKSRLKTSVQHCFFMKTLVMSCNVLHISESTEVARYKLAYYYYYYYYYYYFITLQCNIEMPHYTCIAHAHELIQCNSHTTST